MSPVTAFAIIAVSVMAAVGAMLLVRRFAPRGGFFSDSDRAAGVFGVVGTGFAVLLAFVIFIAFESYNNAKDGAAREAIAARELFRTAMLFSPGDRDDLHAELICYGRAVAFDEWRTMRAGRESALVQGWLERLDRSTERVDVTGVKQGVAYGHWFDRAAARQEGRRGRLAEASPFVPPVMWLVLILAGGLVITFVCFFADRAERPAIQALSMTAVATMVVSGLLLVRFLDRPYEDSSGSVKPTAMVDAVTSIERQRDRLAPGRALPCEARGTPRA